jgi:hypothetical protein
MILLFCLFILDAALRSLLKSDRKKNDCDWPRLTCVRKLLPPKQKGSRCGRYESGEARQPHESPPSETHRGRHLLPLLLRFKQTSRFRSLSLRGAQVLIESTPPHKHDHWAVLLEPVREKYRLSRG